MATMADGSPYTEVIRLRRGGAASRDRPSSECGEIDRLSKLIRAGHRENTAKRHLLDW